MLQHMDERSIHGLKGAIQITDEGTEGGVCMTLFFADDQGDILALVFIIKLQDVEPYWLKQFKFPNELLVYTAFKNNRMDDKGVSFWYHDQKLHLMPYYRHIPMAERYKIYNPEIILDQRQINSVMLELQTVVRRNTLMETR